MGVFSLLRVSLACLALGGCAVAGISTGSAPATYNINAPDTKDIGAGRWPVQLAVQMPSAARAIDTDRIMIMAGSGRVSYFADTVWSDRLPRLLHSRIVAAMQDAGVFRAVSTTLDGLDSDYTLATELRSFQVEVGSDGGEAVVSVVAKLIHEKRGKVLATKEFTARIPANKDDPDTSVAALQKGFSQVTADLVRWTASFRSRHTTS